MIVEKVKNIINVADLKKPYDELGRTYREINNAKIHAIPVGALVEVKFDGWFGEGGCWKVHARLWVKTHTRDCDGTPLYTLTRWNPKDGEVPDTGNHFGFGEENLKLVEVTQNIIEGNDSLEW